MSKRPISAQSKTAWGDYGGGSNPGSQFDFNKDKIRDDPDLITPDDELVSPEKQRPLSANASPAKEEPTTILGKIARGIRSIWMTKDTENVAEDKELHVKTTLRELIVYCVFLAILTTVAFGMTGPDMFYYSKVVSDVFLDSAGDGDGTFRDITSVDDFWTYAQGPLLQGAYWETWYNGQPVPEEQLGYVYYESKLLGVPRMRQLQVHSNSCVVHDDFKDVIRECYDKYADSIENKRPFGVQDNMTAWYYRSEDELEGSSHWGLLATYSGAGYVQNLGTNLTQATDTIQYLYDNLWVQRATRIVLIDFTLYNANINLFCVVRLTVEFPPTGGAIPHYSLRTVKLLRYVSVMDYFVMACEFIMVVFILYYSIEEAIEIRKHRCEYFKSVWNILDLLVILITVICVAFNVYRTIAVDSLLKELLAKPEEYANFEFLAYGQTQFDNAIAIDVFLAWIKIFKYISFNKTMTQLSSTLGSCAKDLAGFAVMFFIIFIAFCQLGYLLFGAQIKEFSNFMTAFFTLFRIILGDFDFNALEQANRVLGPMFFILYVFFVFFVLINMFLAIINDTYSEVKGDLENQPNELEMGDYFKKSYEKMLTKLNLKQEKIADIQTALNNADLNNDKKVDFGEWRQDLKMRGYADGEIEALFAKYDGDGDRVLNETEIGNMNLDLNDQKAALSKEYNDLQRPESGRRSTSRVSFNDDSEGEGEEQDELSKSARSTRSGVVSGVSYEEFTVLSRRVDRMEHAIGSIVSKIDAVLLKFETFEKSKTKQTKTTPKVLDKTSESEKNTGTPHSDMVEDLVRQRLEKWDSGESSVSVISLSAQQPVSRSVSPLPKRAADSRPSSARSVRNTTFIDEI